MRIPEKKWIGEARYGTLLYFAQIVEDMFWHGTRDSYRPPSLDSYHRSVEISKMYTELREGGIPDTHIMAPVFTEFLSFVSRDLTVKRNFHDVWEIVSYQLGDASSPIESKIRAVRLFERVVGEMYLRRCRTEIENYAENEKPKDKKEFRTLVENYFSYLLNVGHTTEHIYFYTQRHFFDRELTERPRRELQEFFRHFPGRQYEYQIFVGVTDDMVAVLRDVGGVSTSPGIPSAVRRRHSELIASWKKRIVEFQRIRAFDPPGAWAECGRSLSLIRALACTAKPGAELEWEPVMIIVSGDNESGSPFSEPVSPLRRRYRGNADEADRVVGGRRAIISRDALTDHDRNRLLNAITGYADAFHSESPATQLVSLWSSLEGFLPSPRPDVTRIQSFLKDICAAQRRMYLHNQFTWLYVDLIKIYRESLSEVLKEVTEYQEGIAKLFGALCFKGHDAVRKKLGELCGNNPLATQRMFELHMAGTTCGSLIKLVDKHVEKVAWQILRIYRERNRIVHRANPSKNVSSLIVNLNEYILVTLEAFFRIAGVDEQTFSVDDIFSEIAIREEARARNVARVSAEPLTVANANLAGGFALL